MKDKQPCPRCLRPTVTSVEAMGIYGWVDYFRCRACGHVWHLPKGRDEPITHVTTDRPVSAKSA